MNRRVLKRVKSLPRRFASNSRGAVAPMFGILFAMLLLPLAGAGIDLTRLFTSRAALQDALDAAALALAKMPVNTTQAQLQTAADQWMASNLKSQYLTSWAVQVTPFYASGGNTVSSIRLAATGVVPSIFTGVIGGVNFVQYPVGATASSSWGLQHVEVAMVLDNTGSMAQSDGSGGTKAQTLKDSANALIDTLADTAAATGDPNVFKIGMVPFATYVNVGAGNKGPWITGSSPYASDVFNPAGTDRFDLFSKLGVPWGGCVESRPMPYDVQDTAPTPGTPSMFVPYFAPDEPDDVNASSQNIYYNNYIPDAAAPGAPFEVTQFNADKYYKGATPAVSHPSIYAGSDPVGPNRDCSNVPLIRMTTTYSAVKSAINALSPAGNTHIPLGLVWGWHLVSPNAPFADGSPYNTQNVRKVVILVTDGDNTYYAGTASPSAAVNNQQSPALTTDNSVTTAYGYVWQHRISQDNGSFDDPARAMNDRLKQLCVNMKNAGITLYTIPLRVTDPNTKGMLQTCASGASNYLEAANGDQLRANFRNIAGAISALRIAK